MSLLRFSISSKTENEPVETIPRKRKKHPCIDFALLLAQTDLSEDKAKLAWTSLREEMALVPEGEVLMVATDVDSLTEIASQSAFDPAWVESFYIDRTCVTNAAFAEFVEAGGYADENLWPEEILSNLLQFVDATEMPGPAMWRDGAPSQDKLDHPVTGICWYEANAYAHWRGKRLPSPAEWQWSVVWSGAQSAAQQRRYPWGNAFEASKCNTWNSGIGSTSNVRQFDGGSTSNGVYQLIGNVWEWTSALFEFDENRNGDRVLTEFPMAEIRGGAFDTYFSSQATAQFRTGQSLMHRGHNVGFRCCLSVDQIVASSNPFDFLEDSENV